MKKFSVCLDIAMTCNIHVEAENEWQAKQIAQDLAYNDPWKYVKDADSCADIVVVETREES